MNKKVYNTRPRTMLLDFFETNKNKSFSSRDIIDRFNGKISAPTVYRLLKNLSGQGLLRGYNEDGTDGMLYQYSSGKCHNHIHMTCLKCGVIYHLDCDFINDISNHIKSDHNFIVDNYKTVIFGLCEKCCQKSVSNEK